MAQPILAAQLYTVRDFTRTVDDFTQTMRKVRQIGYSAVQLSAIGPFPPEQVRDIVATAGLTFSYHNHAFEFERFPGEAGTALDLIYNETNPAYVQAEIDVYWVQFGGADPAAWIRRVRNRMPVVHLKDMTMQANQQIMAEVGEGNLNWPAILDACREANVEWYAVEQDRCQRDPFESLAISYRNLHGMGLA